MNVLKGTMTENHLEMMLDEMMEIGLVILLVLWMELLLDLQKVHLLENYLEIMLVLWRAWKKVLLWESELGFEMDWKMGNWLAEMLGVHLDANLAL